jgi:hypothetical protein
LVFFNLKQASYAPGYYPNPRTGSRNILPTSAQGKKSADTPCTTNPSGVGAHGQVHQQTKRHDVRGSGGGGRMVGGRGSGSRDSGGRVKHPRGVVLGENPRQEWEDNHVQPPRPVGGQGQHQGQGQGQGQGQDQRRDYVGVPNDKSDWNVFNASRTNQQQHYQWSLVAFGDDTPQSNDLRYTLANGSSIGAIVPHINETELHVLDVQTMAVLPAVAGDTGDYDDTEGDNIPMISLFSPLVEATIGQALINNLHINKISSMGDMFRHDFGGANIDNARGRGFAESIVNTSPVNVMGHAKMLSGNIISTFNRLGQKELVMHDGKCEINSGYYRNQVEYRGSAGEQLCWIVLGMSLPKVYLHVDQHANHLAGYDALRHLNAAVEGDCIHPTIKCRLYNAYAQVFCRMMEAPIVAKARAYHYEPVFFFKNMLLKRNPFGNHFELYSLDRGARTSINIIGFSRKKANSPMEFLALKGKNDALATVRG